MSEPREITKDILLKLIDSGTLPFTGTNFDTPENVLNENLDIVTKAYKEIFKAVNSPNK